jgi:hypothetical protein
MNELCAFVVGWDFELVDLGVISKLFATAGEGFTVGGVHMLC